MSLNHRMHPRNLYRTKPDFKQIAQQFTDFEKFLKIFPNGKATIDFKNPDAVRRLNQILLLKDFSLDLLLPPTRLTPIVPQRLNYVLWVEDLVTLLEVEPGKQVSGIDIGTGASCIFPLLICRKNRSWSMKALEIDPESFSIAQQNVVRNNLQDRISVILNESSTKFSSIIFQNESRSYHFLMCNPPFFKDAKEMSEESMEEVLKKSPANNSAEVESSCDGGEVAFVDDLIKESYTVAEQVKIFTVMLGKKSSLLALKQSLRSAKESGHVTSFITTEFCQGKTMRWGLAWTFGEVDLGQNKTHSQKKTHKQTLRVTIEYRPNLNYSIDGITEIILRLVEEELKIDFEITRRTKKSSEIVVRSDINTWSHQRRKRREKCFPHSNSGMSGDCAINPSLCSVKRKRDDSDDELCDEFLELESCSTKKVKEVTVAEGLNGEASFLLEAILVIRKEGKDIFLELTNGDKCRDRETVHQLLQFFKNKI